MHDTKGKILGHCGRALDGKEPMLIFPKNFAPNSVAFNWHQVRDTDFVHLCPTLWRYYVPPSMASRIASPRSGT